MKGKMLFRQLGTTLLAGAVSFSALSGLGFAGAAQPEEEDVLPYQDVNRSFEERAVDLVSRMTLEEKISQLGNDAAAIPRLDVAEYRYWNEALHGVANEQEATSFPYSLGMAATWDRELILDIASATSDEARGYAEGKGKGLDYWSPTVNMSRHPLWGRNLETYGEDPFLTTQIGNSFVRGMQGDDDRYLKTIATLKHFAANNSEYNRHNGNSVVNDRDLREYYTRAFKDIVAQADVGSVMTSYNKLNGVPTAANDYLLDTLLRKTFGFTGYVTSDCGAIADISGAHKWVPEGWDRLVNAEEAVAFAIKAGNDLNCGQMYTSYAAMALEKGLLTESDIDQALVRIFTGRMKTGEFDPADMVPYRSDEYTYENQVEAQDHKQLAEDSADDAVVLLKNEAAQGESSPILPLKAEETNKIVVVGEAADDVILGGYSGHPTEANTSTPLAGIEKALKAENPDADLQYITGYTASDKGMRNLLKLEFLDEDGQVVKTLNANQNTKLEGCQLENGSNLGYVKPDAYAEFSNVFSGTDELNRIKTVRAYTGGKEVDTQHTMLEVYMNAPGSGDHLVTTIDTQPTSEWSDYQPFDSGACDFGGYTDKLYVVFRAVGTADFTQEEEQAIREADSVVVYIGTQINYSGEGNDRKSLDLPNNEDEMVNQVAALNPRTVVYIQTVGPVNVEPFKDNVPALLWCTYNGQAQGNAAGRLLFGQKNPNAKLPFTWYADESQLPTIDEYDVRSSEEYNGWTYQYFKGDITYPFGYGLSYTTFEYSDVKLDKTEVTPDDTLEVTLTVKNTGTVAGKEIVQVYMRSPAAADPALNRPAKQLKGFEKVELDAGESKTVTIRLDVSDWYFWDEEAEKEVFDKGTYTLEIGASSQDIRSKQEVALTSDRDVQLEVVTARPSSVVMKLGNTAQTELTLALNDESFLDPKEAQVVYTSSDGTVASVDENGVITAKAAGVATITARVTYKGAAVESSFALAVKDDTVSAYELIASTNYSEKQGSLKADGAAMEEIRDGDWLRFNNVDFGEGFRLGRFTALASVNTDERNGGYLNGERAELSELTLNRPVWDGSQLLVGCTSGQILTLPDCTQCNKLETVSESALWTMACNGEIVLTAGEGFTYQMTAKEAVTQEQIRPAAALEKQRAGAVIVDVRTAEEYAACHIRGSVNLPVGQVETLLPQQYPDLQTELIFYCSAGQRSQTALQAAKRLGYSRVYNLGKLSDWPYETQGNEGE